MYHWKFHVCLFSSPLLFSLAFINIVLRALKTLNRYETDAAGMNGIQGNIKVHLVKMSLFL